MKKLYENDRGIIEQDFVFAYIILKDEEESCRCHPEVIEDLLEYYEYTYDDIIEMGYDAIENTKRRRAAQEHKWKKMNFEDWWNYW